MPKKIRLRLDRLETDPSRYKIYHPHFVPEKNVFFEFELPSSMMNTEKDGIVLSLDGLMVICHEICDHIEEADRQKEIDDVDKWQKERREGD